MRAGVGPHLGNNTLDDELRRYMHTDVELFKKKNKNIRSLLIWGPFMNAIIIFIP